MIFISINKNLQHFKNGKNQIHRSAPPIRELTNQTLAASILFRDDVNNCYHTKCQYALKSNENFVDANMFDFDVV